MDPSETELTLAAKLIRAGRLVAFPTETVYGLGANALDEAAVRRIYDAKGRPATSPSDCPCCGRDHGAAGDDGMARASSEAC